MDFGSTPCRIFTNGKAPTAKIYPKRTNFFENCARTWMRNSPVACCSAEANQWPEDAAAYFGKGDESHMSFHFPLMPRMFMSLQMEDRFPIIDIMEQTPAIPGELSVGNVPAQPRRAYAGNGDRRGARLHVSRLRDRPSRPDQSRHPPPACAATCEQPPKDRAAQNAALFHARHTNHLLRR